MKERWAEGNGGDDPTERATEMAKVVSAPAEASPHVVPVTAWSKTRGRRRRRRGEGEKAREKARGRGCRDVTEKAMEIWREILYILAVLLIDDVRTRVHG